MAIKIIQVNTVLRALSSLEIDEGKLPVSHREGDYEDRIARMRQALRDARDVIERLVAERRLSAEARRELVETIKGSLLSADEGKNAYSYATSTYTREFFNGEEFKYDTLATRDICRALIDFFGDKLATPLWRELA